MSVLVHACVYLPVVECDSRFLTQHNVCLALIEFPTTRESLILRISDPADADAWEEFVATYRPAVYRIATLKGLQHADALDLVQVVFVAIAGSIDRWKKSSPSTPFRHWLARVAKNATLNALTRRAPFQPPGGSAMVSLLQEVPAADAETREMVELEYRRELFRRAAQQVQMDVNTDTWKAFQLTAIDGLTSEMAARELGKSIGTIYACRSRVMKRLAVAVAELGGGSDEN